MGLKLVFYTFYKVWFIKKALFRKVQLINAVSILFQVMYGSLQLLLKP